MVEDMGERITVVEFDSVFETLSKKRQHQEEQKMKSRNIFKKKEDADVDLKDFDVVMYDDSISRQLLKKGKSLFKRRSYAFPVKLKGDAN